MGPLAKIIAMTLVIMAIASVGVVVERLIVFYRSNKESRRFVAAAGPLIDEWKLDEIVVLAKKHKASMLAGLFVALIDRF
ncbi:MAG: tolQ protein, partial [Polyangiaceae bacterium]|nr:tolQ protein [Polyangiaceae bacterium]